MRAPARGILQRTRLIVFALAAVSIAGCGQSAATTAPAPSTSVTASVAPASPSLSTPSVAPTPSQTPTPTPTPKPEVPDFAHVYVIVLENKEYGRIVNSAAAPYINSLIARYGLATNFYGETHPSEPNYIALTSGGLQGTRTDGTYNLSVDNLFDQVEASGRTWRVYAQGYPGNCFKTYIANPVVDGPGAAGEYVRKHNPAISYTSISGNPTRCAAITGLKGFDPAAADLELIIPNQINDMHSSSVAAGDAFLKAFVPSIVGSPAFAGSVLFITFDEGDTNLNGGGHIATIVVSPGLPPGSRFTATANHYAILRTIELAWGLPLLGEARSAPTIDLAY